MPGARLKFHWSRAWAAVPGWAWLVVGTLVIGMILGSLSLYQVLKAQQHENVTRYVDDVAGMVETDLRRGLEEQIRLQGRMARRLAYDGPFDQSAWSSDARDLLKDYPFYRGLAVIDRDFRVRWLESAGTLPFGENETFVVAADMRRRLSDFPADREALISQPFGLPDNRVGIAFFTPIRSDPQHVEAFLGAVLVVQAAADQLLAGPYRQDVQVTAKFAGTPLFTIAAGGTDVAAELGQRFSLQVDSGPSLDFLIEPRQAAIDQMLSPLPAVILGAGIALSLVFAAAALLAFGAAGQARVLARANRRLEDEIRDRELAEQELEFLVTHDALTGLPNRTGISRRLEQWLAGAGEKEQLAVLVMDLDQFKDINDSLGHSLGDQLLRLVPERLGRVLHDNDILGRHGGDEFVIAVSRKNRDQIHQLARNILESMDKGFAIEGSRFFISGSIGIAFYPESGTSVSELIQNADAAVYRAKQSGRNQYAVFSPEMFGQIEYRLNLSRDIRQALEADQFKVVYQPVVSLEDFSLCGLEALLRWQHEKGYSVPPQEFIRVAEETGSIHRLSRFALRTALSDLAVWRRLAEHPPWLAVNISGAQFRQAGFVEDLSMMLHEHRLDPALVHLEITEQVLIENLTRNQRMLRELDKIGMRIVVDDFGVGYSSLAYLKNFPVSVVKIDQGFIRDLEVDREDQTITRTICNLARELGMQTVAEGVEHERQLQLLRRFGCQLGQGFLFSRPVDAETVGTILGGDLPWRDLMAVKSPT